MIEIRDLHHQYPDGTRALKGINLKIHDGEFLLICGPNGSGKTTLVRLICGLFNPTSGSVSVDGLHLDERRRSPGSLVGMVFQDSDAQLVGETVREDVAFGPENMGLSGDEVSRRVNWALQVMGLEGLSERSCYLLSGGEKRRVAIAGVLAMKPRTILFDEPFTHLDYPGVQEVLRHMISLHREGHTLVVTTHDVEKVIGHVDRIALIHRGELKALGSAEEIVPNLSRFGIRPPCYALLGTRKVTWLSE